MATRASYATKSDVSGVRAEVRLVREELHDVRGDIRAVGVMVESLRSTMSVIAEGFSTVARKSELAEVDSVRSLAADVRKAQRTPKTEKRAGGKR